MDSLEDLKNRLDSKDIYCLRQVAREVGITKSTKFSKDGLIAAIMDIASGAADPEPQNKRGAPPKSKYFDEFLVSLVRRCRDLSLEGDGAVMQDIRRLTAAEDGLLDEEKIVSGIAEERNNQIYIRAHNMEVDLGKDVFIPPTMVKAFSIATGDRVVCKCVSDGGDIRITAKEIVSVNTLAPARRELKSFTDSVAVYPAVRMYLGDNGGPDFGRFADLFAPVAFGQRVLIGVPDFRKKRDIVTKLAASISKNYPYALTVALLLDKRPEDVTYIERNVGNAEVYSTTFEKGAARNIHTAELTLEYVKRQVSSGRDVVLIVDSVTNLVKSYNGLLNPNAILSEAFNSGCMSKPKELFVSARKAEGGASLTLLCLFDSARGDLIDARVLNEFSEAALSRIFIPEEEDGREKYPYPIVLGKSGSDISDETLTEEEKEAKSILTQKLGSVLDKADAAKQFLSAATLSEYCAYILGKKQA